MRLVFIDTETYCYYNIKEVGAYKYALHCELLMVTWCEEDGPSHVWVVEEKYEEVPPKLLKLLKDKDVTLVAHNYLFDREVLGKYFPWVKKKKWKCTMAMAGRLGYPLSLAALGAAIRIDAESRKYKGGRLISLFTKPAPKNHHAKRYDWTTHPEEWNAFIAYAKQDVIALREIYNKLPHWTTPMEEYLFCLDTEINDRGLPVDVELAEAAIASWKHLEKNLLFELDLITGGRIKSAGNLKKIIEYLDKIYDIQLPDLRADTVKKTLYNLEKGTIPWRILKIRQTLSKTSVTKYIKVIDANVKGRIRGTLQYCGAGRTGRWAGRLFQPQNLVRPTMNVSKCIDIIKSGKIKSRDPLTAAEIFTSALRGLIWTPDGNIISGDKSQIEARSLQYLAGSKKGIKVFEDGLDPYKAAASDIFIKEYDKVSDHERFLGKVCVLMLGYGGGYKTVIRTCENYGVEIEEEEAKELVKAWRKTNPEVVNLWQDIENAFASQINLEGAKAKRVRHVGISTIIEKGIKYILIRLPSGRCLAYATPKYHTFINEETGERNRQLSYMGVTPISLKWKRIPVYGGKLVAHINQAFARDVMARNAMEVHRQGVKLIFTFHDELIAEEESPLDYDIVMQALEQPISWAKGLPMKASGFSEERYRK